MLNNNWASACQYSKIWNMRVDLSKGLLKTRMYNMQFFVDVIHYLGFPGGSVVKNMPANAGDASLIPGSGKSPEEEVAIHSSILAWRIPWTEDPGGLQSMGPQHD